jgi:2-C-methyl-D-erythritol 2,4-cyclodiphosphate synthase
MFPFRIGQGVDVHRLSPGRRMILGGVELEHHSGPDGHSDADVLIHAICDALLGAANLGDIGKILPYTDAELKNIDSTLLLKKVKDLIADEGYLIGNIDTTLILEKPKIKAYIPKMQEVLGNCLGIDSNLISIKATTNEKMGYVGREEGVLAYAVCLLYSEKAGL